MRWNLARLLPGECIPGIVHDTVKVIDFSQRVHLPRLHLQKVILLSCEGKKGKEQMKYEAESHCVTICMCVKGECSSTPKNVSYNEATDTKGPPASVQDTVSFCQWYFMHFRMVKVLTFDILLTKILKIWPECRLWRLALYMQLTISGLLEICRLRMSVCPPPTVVFSPSWPRFSVCTNVLLLLFCLLLHLSNIIAEGLLRDLRSYLAECCPW